MLISEPSFYGSGAAYAHIAMEQAINDSGLTEKEVSNIRTGLVAGSGGPSTSAMLTAHQTVLKNSSPRELVHLLFLNVCHLLFQQI